jgi:hypothetical protein
VEDTKIFYYQNIMGDQRTWVRTVNTICATGAVTMDRSRPSQSIPHNLKRPSPVLVLLAQELDPRHHRVKQYQSQGNILVSLRFTKVYLTFLVDLNE